MKSMPRNFVGRRLFPGGDHGFTEPAHRARARAAMIAWFDRYLR